MNTPVSPRFGMPRRRRAVSLLAAAALTSGALAATAAPASAATTCKPGFAPAVNYRTANPSLYTATADFNGDHKTDVVAYGPGGTAEVLLGKGDGTFRPAVIAGTSSAAVNLPAVGSVNSDDDSTVDIITTDPIAGMIRVFPGNGDGTFDTAIDSLAVANVLTATPGDFNDDGRLDVLVASGSNDNSIMLGNGDGTFQAPVVTGFTGYSYLAGVADFDGDGDDDVAFADGGPSGSGALQVILSNGDGSFGPATPFAQGTSPVLAAPADFNNDHKVDLITVGMSGGAVLLGKGDGTFLGALPYTGSGAMSWPTLGDYNGDGKQDAVYATPTGGSLLFGKGNGTFQAPVTFKAPMLGMMASGRFNADSRSDLVLPNPVAHGVSVMLAGCVTPAAPKPTVKPKPAVELKWKTKVKLEKPKLKKIKKVRGGGVK
ncbi:FG-GAP repeat domain-containing protein [Planobispora takensis]|uniref:VCBS repeat-containing protein n=1 Tax=Planobispora takensis TaxID=1367882 RepID=A0A8J3WWZ9_9ACTN|nr:VCBS repeat-containing protein [Planobispora takensis]GII05351.1 hypothetical protein Pta02_73590 [Planobispora takensis]